MSIRNNVAIIYSEASRQAFITEARNRGQVYQFRGSRETLNWLRGDVAYLAVNGVASLLRRLSIKFDILGEEECSLELLKEYHTLFIPNACRLLEQTIATLEKWLGGDVKLVVSGSTNLPEQLLGIASHSQYTPEGFCGIKWLLHLRFNPQHEDYIFSPPEYPVRVVSSQKDSTILGKLIEYQNIEEVKEGEYLNGDAVVIGEKTIYFALPIFEYIAGILQGHICIEPLRKSLGEEGNFYIDTLTWYVKNILFHYGHKRLWQTQLKPWGEYDNVLVLRHDTDFSADPSYLEYEIANKIPATYAILPDKNRKFYLSRVAPYDFLEGSYHFKSAVSQSWLRGTRPDKKAITEKGLAEQAEKAKRKHGIHSATLHKHGSAFYYPETIEAMDYLYESFPEIIGMGTMFRFSNIKYSGDATSNESYTVTHPDVSVPFWFPFKMEVSTIEQHKTLRGWDITHFIEPYPSLIDLIVENSSKLPEGVYMLGFHPAHARKDTFNPGGDYEWFRYSLDKAGKYRWWVANYKTVCQRLNNWEILIFRVIEDGLVMLENPTAGEISNIVISCGDKLLSVVSDRGEVNFKDNYIHIPMIAARSTMEIRYELET